MLRRLIYWFLTVLFLGCALVGAAGVIGGMVIGNWAIVQYALVTTGGSTYIALASYQAARK